MGSLVLAHSAFADGKDIYGSSTGITAVDNTTDKVIKAVAGIGTTAFTLAFLIIALCLAFMSMSPQNSSRMWKALLVCLAAAVIFFSAYMFPSSIKNMA